MFFSITKTPQDNFACTYQEGNFCINTDEGWEEFHLNDYAVVYKGYVEGNTLLGALDEIIAETEPALMGNFCAIIYNTETRTISIKTDRYRSFPLYVGTDTVTNLEKQGRTVWADGLIQIDEYFNVTETKFDVIGDIDLSPVTLDKAMELIDHRLSQRTEAFLKYNTLPIRVHLSGGVDSLLVYSYLQKYTNEYTKVTCRHVEYDHFWLQNSGTITESYWGYKQIHHWREDCVLISGAPGDEFMLRSPATADLLMKFRGIRIEDLLSKPCYHQDYFLLPKNFKIFAGQELDKKWDEQQLVWELCNNIVNDWQHWHIGNTLTWTPLRDLEIFKIFLRLSTADALTQILDSAISIKLIEKNCTGLSQLLSDQKNSGNPLKNLGKFYSLVK